MVCFYHHKTVIIRWNMNAGNNDRLWLWIRSANTLSYCVVILRYRKPDVFLSLAPPPLQISLLVMSVSTRTRTEKESIKEIEKLKLLFVCVSTKQYMSNWDMNPGQHLHSGVCLAWSALLQVLRPTFLVVMPRLVVPPCLVVSTWVFVWPCFFPKTGLIVPVECLVPKLNEIFQGLSLLSCRFSRGFNS